jgi:hypothetical protein
MDMKLWKRDTENWTVREVDGDPWPGIDSDGDKCYTNTHFETEAVAWASLYAEARAWLSLSTRALLAAREDLARREKECVEASLALAGVMQAMPSNTGDQR